jgi:hypothetical protein
MEQEQDKPAWPRLEKHKTLWQFVFGAVAAVGIAFSIVWVSIQISNLAEQTEAMQKLTLAILQQSKPTLKVLPVDPRSDIVPYKGSLMGYSLCRPVDSTNSFRVYFTIENVGQSVVRVDSICSNVIFTDSKPCKYGRAWPHDITLASNEKSVYQMETPITKQGVIVRLRIYYRWLPDALVDAEPDVLSKHWGIEHDGKQWRAYVMGLTGYDRELDRLFPSDTLPIVVDTDVISPDAGRD